MLADPLSRRRCLPPNARWEGLPVEDGELRSVRWAGDRGSILFIAGRADFIEKYSEAYWAWLAAGFGVTTFDWRGQGRSGRLGRGAHEGHGDFDRWTDDLAAVVARFVGMTPPPHHLVAHSMGGHLTLRYLAKGGAGTSRVVLLAPMLGIAAARSPLVQRIVDVAVRSGFGERYAPLQRGYGTWQQRPERQALLTGCADRFADEHWWIANDPALALGGVTYGWLASAFRSIDSLFAEGILERMTTPTLILAGEHERLVDLDAMRRAAARLPRARFELVPGAHHELLREVEPVQADVHARLAAFLEA